MNVVKKMFTVCAALSMLVFSSYSLAERTIEEVYKQCGIGGALFGQSSPTLAFISNVTWDLGTTAATSDSTGGCAIDSSEMAAIFINESYDQLAAEIAIGNGDYYHAMVSLVSCASATTDDVKSAIRSKFTEAVSSDGYMTMDKTARSQQLLNIVSPMLASSRESACIAS